MESYFQKHEREAVEKLSALLALPLPESELGLGDIDTFDPWTMFPLYGTYSSEFDECALDVLRELLSGDKERRELGAEMFRELLCNLYLCGYGSSPRVCFPTNQFRELLPAFIKKWEAYSALQWATQEQQPK